MKKILISLLSIIFIISMFSSVYAATATISSGSSAETVVKGKTFTVTLAGTSDSPIDGMYTKFTYDKNVLSLEAATAGENYGNNSSEGEILVTNNSSSESPKSATLYTITFKVLDSANVESTTISFSESALHLNVEGTVREEATTIEDVTISIKADDTTADNQGGTTQDTEEPKTETPSNTDNDKSNTSSNNTSKNTSTNKNTNKKLPQTGLEDISVVALVALGAISIASYVLYRKYKNI